MGFKILEFVILASFLLHAPSASHLSSPQVPLRNSLRYNLDSGTKLDLPQVPEDRYFLVLRFFGDLYDLPSLRIEGGNGWSHQLSAKIDSCKVYTSPNLTCAENEVSDLLRDSYYWCDRVNGSLPGYLATPQSRVGNLNLAKSYLYIYYSFIDCAGSTTAAPTRESASSHRSTTTPRQTEATTRETASLHHGLGGGSSSRIFIVIIIVLANLLTVATIVAAVALYKLKKISAANATGGGEYRRNAKESVATSSTSNDPTRSGPLYRNVAQRLDTAYEEVEFQPEENPYLTPMEITRRPV